MQVGSNSDRIITRVILYKYNTYAVANSKTLSVLLLNGRW